MLVDTGAASTVIDADLAADVFVRRIDRLAIGDYGLHGFDVEIGEMEVWRSVAARGGRTVPTATGTSWPSRMRHRATKDSCRVIPIPST
jgi:hypothetical protein